MSKKKTYAQRAVGLASPVLPAPVAKVIGTRYVIRNATWNGTIAAGAEISFGFQVDGIAGELPTNKKVNGRLVA